MSLVSQKTLMAKAKHFLKDPPSQWMRLEGASRNAQENNPRPIGLGSSSLCPSQEHPVHVKKMPTTKNNDNICRRACIYSDDPNTTAPPHLEERRQARHQEVVLGQLHVEEVFGDKLQVRVKHLPRSWRLRCVVGGRGRCGAVR